MNFFHDRNNKMKFSCLLLAMKLMTALKCGVSLMATRPVKF